MTGIKRTLAILAATLFIGGVIAFILYEQSVPATPPALMPATAKSPAMSSADSLAADAMKKLDDAFPGSPGAEPPGVVIFGQSGARYILSSDAVADFSGRHTQAAPNASALRYTVRVDDNTLTVDSNNRGTATTVVLTSPPPGTAPDQTPPLTVTTRDTTGTTSIQTVPTAEYARDSGIIKIGPTGTATFILPDDNIAIKKGRIYNSTVSKGGKIVLDGGSLGFSSNTATP